MRNAFKFLVASALIAGTVTAQEKTESVDSILNELNSRKGGSTAPVATPTAVEASPVAAAVVETPVVAADELVTAAPVEVAAAEPNAELDPAATDALDVPATLDASRELYVGGEFEQAQKGFEAVIKKDPENIVARSYLRKILERDPRTAEVEGIKNVKNAWKAGVVLRSYDLSTEAVEKIGLQDAKDSMDVSMKFPEVKFPKGASAVYQPKTGKLFIRNTTENLLVIEEIMAAMDVSNASEEVDQVEIEAKFVEVAEGTLEQLGFEWQSLAGNNYNVGDKGNIAGGQFLFDDALRGGPSNGQGSTLPFRQTDGLAPGYEIDSAGSGEWKAFRFEDTFSDTPASMRVKRESSGNPFDVVITALDQSSGTDVLSAPRIVTKSGEKATIRVGNLHYFPEVYEVGSNEGNIIHVSYQDFTEKLLGVELNVQPQIEGDQITMKLNPKVNDLLGWQNYSIVSGNSSYAYYQYRMSGKFTHDPIEARLPIFNRREIETEVTINDGSTIGMGGLISDRIEKYEDKVPLLGSIPLIGRLFRNEGERAIKRNLMIFVSAKKVEPSGRITTSRTFE